MQDEGSHDPVTDAGRGGGRRRWLLLGAVLLVFVVAGVAALTLPGGENPTVVTAARPSVDQAGTDGSPPSDAPDEVAAREGDAFPSVRSQDLNGEEVELPGDLPGDPTVVLLSWGRADQDPVDAWIDVLAGLEAEHDGLDHVQLAVTGDSSAVTRTTVNFFMRQAMPDEEVRARTIPLFTDPVALADLLGIAADAGVASVVVDANGMITWRHTGEVDATVEAALSAHLDGSD